MDPELQADVNPTGLTPGLARLSPGARIMEPEAGLPGP